MTQDKLMLQARCGSRWTKLGAMKTGGSFPLFTFDVYNNELQIYSPSILGEPVSGLILSKYEIKEIIWIKKFGCGYILKISHNNNDYSTLVLVSFGKRKTFDKVRKKLYDLGYPIDLNKDPQKLSFLQSTNEMTTYGDGSPIK